MSYLSILKKISPYLYNIEGTYVFRLDHVGNLAAGIHYLDHLDYCADQRIPQITGQ